MFVKDPLWIPNPKTVKGIIPQLYGDFSTYTPNIHPRSFLSASGRSKGFEGSMEILNPFQAKVKVAAHLSDCSFNKTITSFTNRPEAALKLQDWLDASCQHSRQHWLKSHNLSSTDVLSSLKLKKIRCKCPDNRMSILVVFFLNIWRQKKFWLCKISLLLFCSFSERITRNVNCLIIYIFKSLQPQAYFNPVLTVCLFFIQTPYCSLWPMERIENNTEIILTTSGGM